jgi:hypothetical protein
MEVPFSNNQTSREAAVELRRSGKAMTQMQRVLLFIEGAGERGCTSSEVEAGTRLPARQVSARINALKKRGLVMDSKRTRMGPFGMAQAVYVPGCDLMEIQNGETPRVAAKLKGREATVWREAAAMLNAEASMMGPKDSPQVAQVLRFLSKRFERHATKALEG